MREIKFRVFDRCHKSMHIVGTDRHDALSCFDGEVQYYNMQNGEGSGEYGDYTLMQYTGLKDKNGVEIYEGDVYENPSGVLVIITFNIETSAYEGKTINRTYGNLPLFNKNKSGNLKGEVIGNIYENPELLEQDNERTS